MLESDSNVKLIVRIRNPKENHPKNYDEFMNSIKPHIGSKTPTGQRVTQNIKQMTKSPKLNKKQKEDSIKKPTLKENHNYTIFTSVEPSDTVVISNKPITGRLINTSCRQTSDLYDYNHNLMKDTTLLEFDRVYNETHKLDTVYLEQVKDCVSNLFQAKNSSIIFFGPSEGGKSYLSRGSDLNCGGITARSVQEIFNLIEISTQANAGKLNKSSYYTAGVSIYQIYNDNINDLLSHNPAKQLQIRTFYDHDTGKCFTQIVDLAIKTMKSKKDYDNILTEAIHTRKILANTLKINDMKKKSHMVISLVLEKREKLSDGVHKITEKSIEKFAQMDFVELASSNIGLPSVKIPDSDYQTNDDINAATLAKNFETLSANLVASATNTPSKVDSKLTLALKPTLNSDADTLLFTCVLATEYPPTSSMKALKFINWMRNQIVNHSANLNYGKINKNKHKHNNSHHSHHKINSKSSEEDMNINYDENKDDDGPYTHNKSTRLAGSPSNNSRLNPEDRFSYSPKSQHQLQYGKGQSDKHQQSYMSNNEMAMKHNKGLDLEKSVKGLDNQNQDLSRHVDNLRNHRSKLEEHSNMKYNQSLSNYNDYESDKMRQEFYTVKSDNILYKEEVNLLHETNRKLEDDLAKQHTRNLELAAEVEKAVQEKIMAKKELEKIKMEITNNKILDNNINDHFNYRMATEMKMREMEQENKKNFDERQKFEIDYRVLLERYNELKRISSTSDTELNFLKNKQNDEMIILETRLVKMQQELEFIQRENNNLRVNDERLRNEINNLEKQRDTYSEKYHDYKGRNNLLNSKLEEVENEVKKLLYEKNQEIVEKKKDEGTKRSKMETKAKILADMQNKIANYKTNLIRGRQRDDSQ